MLNNRKNNHAYAHFSLRLLLLNADNDSGFEVFLYGSHFVSKVRVF
uniref:Uncharacterized protein n=1 Tax=Escherichia coli TaxID=562 RepID=A0A7L8K9E7_ECOLX|nr:hypothetical protein TP123_192 [Escherichia coli]UWM21985.1 hypothetical protein [Morganella morganii]UWM22286.1 hypothetical protein [Klebsiella pneumoniae]QQA03441.1 hypothetical protein [Escherichia coli]UMW91589.1 hypothetical protein [Escherichia coli]